MDFAILFGELTAWAIAAKAFVLASVGLLAYIRGLAQRP